MVGSPASSRSLLAVRVPMRNPSATLYISPPCTQAAMLPEVYPISIKMDASWERRGTWWWMRRLRLALYTMLLLPIVWWVAYKRKVEGGSYIAP